MLFNIDKWSRYHEEENFAFKAGEVQLRFSHPVALFAVAVREKVIVGVGHTFDLKTSQDLRFYWGDVDVECFVNRPVSDVSTPDDVSFTNFDHYPIESGAVFEVRKAMREMQLEQRENIGLMRKERALLHAARTRHDADGVVIEVAAAVPPAAAADA